MQLTRRSFLQALAGAATSVALVGPLALRAPSLWLKTRQPTGTSLTIDAIERALEDARMTTDSVPSVVWCSERARRAFERALAVGWPYGGGVPGGAPGG